MTRRTRAFTLQELLIVMILSSILLSTAYYGLRVVQQYYHDFSQRSARNLRYQTLQSQLQQDFSRATHVEKEENVIVCYLTNQVVSYEFSDEAVVRTQGTLSETFPGSAQDMRCYFQEDEVVFNRQPISELRFTMEVEAELLSFRAHKTYAADALINTSLWPD